MATDRGCLTRPRAAAHSPSHSEVPSRQPGGWDPSTADPSVAHAQGSPLLARTSAGPVAGTRDG